METVNELKHLKGVFFDMDGVLVDSMTHHLQSWKELLEYFTISVSDTFIFEHEGAMSSNVIKDLFNVNGLSIEEDEISTIYSWQNSSFQEKYLKKVGFYPDALSLLRQLNKRGLLLGLVTSSRMNLVEKIWDQEALSLFSTIVTADDVERYKPNPDPYLKALSHVQQELGIVSSLKMPRPAFRPPVPPVFPVMPSHQHCRKKNFSAPRRSFPISPR